MKRTLLYILIPCLLLGLQACDKRDQLEQDVFRITFLRESDGCPSGPLVRFERNDIDRLEQFVHGEFSDEFSDYRVVSAINLNGTYEEGQSFTVKIRKLKDSEMHICLANVRWYVGVYVLE